MRRDARDTDETPGGDSFLDIVANIVGILVLLVVVVGVRAGRQAAFVPEPAVVQAESLDDLRGEAKDAVKLALQARQELSDTQRKLASLASESDRRGAQRAEYLESIERLKDKLERAEQSLDEDTRRDYKVANEIAQAQLRLENLSRDQIALATVQAEPEIETVVCEPTPIVNARADNLVSFRVKAGSVVHVPVEDLMSEFFRSASTPSDGSLIPSRVVRSTHEHGPIEGFMIRGEIAWRVALREGRLGVQKSIAYAELEDATTLRGETIEQASQRGSYTWSRLELEDPEKTVVRFFAYPDSFEEISKLEKSVRERGFRVSMSLIDNGRPIAFSPFGHGATVQ